jgi:uncharacterized protein
MIKDFFSLKEEQNLQELKIENITIKTENLIKYFKITAEALDKVHNSDKDIDNSEKVKDFLLMAESYFNDAKYFAFEKKDFVLAFAALNYAHAWLDAGARIGLFKVKDSRLFTVDD